MPHANPIYYNSCGEKDTRFPSSAGSDFSRLVQLGRGKMKIEGKVVIFNGAGSGFGLHCVHRKIHLRFYKLIACLGLVEEGATVIAVDPDIHNLAKTPALRAYQLDWTDGNGLKKLYQDVAVKYGRIDIVCNYPSTRGSWDEDSHDLYNRERRTSLGYKAQKSLERRSRTRGTSKVVSAGCLRFHQATEAERRRTPGCHRQSHQFRMQRRKRPRE